MSLTLSVIPFHFLFRPVFCLLNPAQPQGSAQILCPQIKSQEKKHFLL